MRDNLEPSSNLRHAFGLGEEARVPGEYLKEYKRLTLPFSVKKLFEEKKNK